MRKLASEKTSYTLAILCTLAAYVLFSFGFPFILVFLMKIQTCAPNTGSCGAMAMFLSFFGKMIGFGIFLLVSVVVCVKRSKQLGLPFWLGITIVPLFLSDMAAHFLFGSFWAMGMMLSQNGAPHGSLCALFMMFWLGMLSPSSVDAVKDAHPWLHFSLLATSAIATVTPILVWIATTRFRLPVESMNRAVFAGLTVVAAVYLFQGWKNRFEPAESAHSKYT